MKSRTAKTQIAYAMFNVYYEGAEPQYAFSFHAENDEDAKDKAWKWGRYHSFSASDYTVKVATDGQAQYIHNEYIPR